MKYSFIAAFTALALLTPALSLAAGVVLSNGGFGQAAGNPQNFGVAVCNHGTETVTQSVPVSVTVGDRSTSIMSGAPIKAGSCSYSYLPYAPLAMEAGHTYIVAVAVDPNHSIITNTDNQVSYDVTVPNSPSAAAGASSAQSANVNAQSGNFFTMLLDWLSRLFK